MDWKRLLPGIVIGGIVLYALTKLKGNSSPQVYNALLPTSTQTPENRDAARTAGFETLASVGLGQLKLQGEAAQLAQSIDLAKQRFSNTLDLARINQQGATDRFLAQLGDRAYDRALQERALDQSFALAQTGNVTQGIGSLVGNILSAIRGSQAGGQQGRSTGASGMPSSPPFNPNANRAATTPAQRAASLNSIARWLDSYRNTGPISPLDYPDLGYVPSFDLYDWSWLDWGNSGLTNLDLLEPVGVVTTDYQLFDSWGFSQDDWDRFLVEGW